MKVVITTIGKFHSFDLARQLHQQEYLEVINSGYPSFKLRNEGLPSNKVHSFPYVQTIYMSRNRLGLSHERVGRELAWLAHRTIDSHVAKRIGHCDVFVGLSGSGLTTGQKVQNKGGIYVCDRGSTHIRYQNRILMEEYKRFGWGEKEVVDPRMVTREEEEYERADIITVPSSVTRQSFIDMGISEDKVHCVPYGVDLTQFNPMSEPNHDQFNVLFVGGASHRKGVSYLLKAFANLTYPRKTLTFVGTVNPAVNSLIEQYKSEGYAITCLGHRPQSELKSIFSTHHVLVLPSIEEGLALVQAQAMACGCPVIASTNTGAADLLTEGVEGFIVPIRDSDAITQRLQLLADHPDLRQRMSLASLERVKHLGGWSHYGDRYIALLKSKI